MAPVSPFELIGEPLHAQSCSSALLPSEAAVAGGRNTSCASGALRVWDYCSVSSDLSVRFLQCSAGQPPASTARTFALKCVNTEEVVRKKGAAAGVLSHLSRESVLQSDVSHGTVSPHLEGSQCERAVKLLEQCVESHATLSEVTAACDELKRKDPHYLKSSWLPLLSLSLRLPTVALLVRCGVTERVVAVLLRPYVHAGNSVGLGYHATLVPVSAASRRLSLSLCGRQAITVPDFFADEEAPQRAYKRCAPLLSGELIRTVGREAFRPVPLHVLTGNAERQQVEWLRGSRVSYVRLRWSSTTADWEVVLVSQRGITLVCVTGSESGASVCGLSFRCARCLADHLSLGDSSPGSSSSASLAVAPHTSTTRAGAVQSSSAEDATPPPAFRCAVGGSEDGLTLLCAEEPSRDVRVVLASPTGSSCPPPCAPRSVPIPPNVDLHDTYVVAHPSVMGAVLCGCSRQAASTPDRCPLALYFYSFGSSALTAVRVPSYRRWRHLSDAFFTGPLQLLRVEVMTDTLGTPSLCVSIGSTADPKAVAAVLVPLPSSRKTTASLILSNGSAVLVEHHVVHTLATHARQEEWSRGRGCSAGSPPPAPPVEHGSASRSGMTAAKCGPPAALQPWHMEEELIRELRSEILERQLRGTSVEEPLLCLCGVFAGAQRGVEEFCGRAIGQPVADVLRGLSRVLLLATEVVKLSGSVSALRAAVGSLAGSQACVNSADVASRGGTGTPWQELLQPVYDAAYAYLLPAPVSCAWLLPLCSPLLRDTIQRGHAWLVAEELRCSLTIDGTSYPMRTMEAFSGSARPLREVVDCVAGSPEGWGGLSVLDIYWAARRLFLSTGSEATVKLLQRLCTSVTCVESVKELHAMYARLHAKHPVCGSPSLQLVAAAK